MAIVTQMKAMGSYKVRNLKGIFNGFLFGDYFKFAPFPFSDAAGPRDRGLNTGQPHLWSRPDRERELQHGLHSHELGLPRRGEMEAFPSTKIMQNKGLFIDFM